MFEPMIVAKRQRRLSGVGDLPVGEGLTTGEVATHLAEVYGAQVSRQTISTITDKVVEGMHGSAMSSSSLRDPALALLT